MVTVPEKVLYEATTSATGGRRGHARSDDGFIDLDLRPPKEMGGPGGATNPEQLFAAGYAACFQGALGVVGRREGVDTSESEVTCRVGIGPVGSAFGLTVTIEVQIPGVSSERAQELADGAHQTCPYSNATRGNIPVDVIGIAG